MAEQQKKENSSIKPDIQPNHTEDTPQENPSVDSYDWLDKYLDK